MKVIHRLFQYLEAFSIPHTRFEKEAGMSNGYLKTMQKRDADLGEATIIKIIESLPDISLQWLITGRGDMLRKTYPHTQDPPPHAIVNEPIHIFNTQCNVCEQKDKVISAQQAHINTLQHELHRYQCRLDEIEASGINGAPETGQKRKVG